MLPIVSDVGIASQSERKQSPSVTKNIEQLTERGAIFDFGSLTMWESPHATKPKVRMKRRSEFMESTYHKKLHF